MTVAGGRARPAVTFPALLAVVVLLAVACSGGNGSSGTGADRLPALELDDITGSRTVQLDQVEGPAVVNLWATWCAPCRRELPDFEAVHQAMGDDVRFIGVNIGDRADDAARFIDEVGVTFEQLLDVDGALNEALRTAALPVTVVTDATGAISVVHLGPMDAAELIREIERAQSASS